jgi:hypothetical protein
MKACTAEPDSCSWEQFYYFILYTLQGLQGILFSYLCFYNDPKVKGLLLKFAFSLAEKCKICTKNARRKLVGTREPETPELPLDDSKRQSVDIHYSNPFSRKSVQSNSISSSVRRGEAYSWDDIVVKARNSITETSDIAPTPMKRYSKRPSIKDIVMKATVALKKDAPQCEPVKQHQSPETENRRITMKDMVLKATRESISMSKDVVPGDRRKSSFAPKPLTPPLPKIIPDEILDDIQLFNYYYQHLDNILIDDKDKNKDAANRARKISEDYSNRSSRSDLSEEHRDRLKRHTSMEVKSTFVRDDKANVKRMHSYDSGSSSRIATVDEALDSIV